MKNTTPNTDTARRPSLFIVGCALAAGFWFVEAWLDSVLIEDSSFWARLFPPDPNELWMRALVSVLFIGFGLYAHRTNARLVHAELLRIDAARFLKKALSRTIMGHYPICDCCKSIRIHENIWIPPENFITAQSEAEFTSSLCGNCQTRYPADHGLAESKR